jgi:murein DD-endopeptidase MepM/ murein hydrolase activator NlpD
MRYFMKTYKTHIIVFLIISISGLGFWFFNSWGELEKPAVLLDQDITAIGRYKTLNIAFADKKSGLRNSTVTIVQDNQTQVLSAINYTDSVTRESNVSVTIDRLAMKLHEGPATLNISAMDNSIWKNETTLTIQVNIDFMPPQIFLLTSTNNINPGGTCVILYRTSKPVISSGVNVENNFSPGYVTTISDKPCIISYFPLPVEARQGGIAIKVTARDQAGNETSVALPNLIRKKKFRSDKMSLSENFLQQKMPEFQSHNPVLQGKTPLETFIYVNSKMREDNDSAIREICKASNPRQLWEGAFLRMKNAAPMALFGDKRKYQYQGKVVGESIHMGVDLASTTNAPVEAANHGIVAYAGYLGIYGNFVIIDHGFGFFTLYGHMNSIDVKKGQEVRKGDVMGHTGSSGLAGGDHLHFGMLVGGQFVNPQEWWDPHWIADNVTKKTVVSF